MPDAILIEMEPTVPNTRLVATVALSAGGAFDFGIICSRCRGPRAVKECSVTVVIPPGIGRMEARCEPHVCPPERE
jgi:hypothetical protein